MKAKTKCLKCMKFIPQGKVHICMSKQLKRETIINHIKQHEEGKNRYCYCPLMLEQYSSIDTVLKMQEFVDTPYEKTLFRFMGTVYGRPVFAKVFKQDL